MALVSYSGIVSLDGYSADSDGSFAWAEPGQRVHRFINELSRPVVLYLFGRRMYDVMRVWEDDFALAADVPFIAEFQRLWRSTDKIVYSRTLTAPSTARTRVESTFDPEEVARLIAATEGEIAVSGPTLAAHALRAGLVDEVHLFVVPIVIGGGLPFLPDGWRRGLRLLEEKRFECGTVYLRYALED